MQSYDSLPSQPNQPAWKIAECLAVGASIGGAIASAMSAQVAYLAAPVSLSLCLNLINRYRWEKQSQHLSVSIARIYHRFDEMEQSALTLPPTVGGRRLESMEAWEALDRLQESIEERLERLSREQSQIHIRLSQISSQTAELDRENAHERSLKSSLSYKIPPYSLSNGKDPNSSLLKDLEYRIVKIEELDLIAQQSTLEHLKQLVSAANPSLEERLQEQEAIISHLQERLAMLEGLEVENQLLEVLEIHLRLYKWQQELTAEINQRLTPVVAEMHLGKQRQLALENKIAELGASNHNGGSKNSQIAQN